MKKKALCFGDFTLKSGRKSPYFFNASRFNDGESLWHLGQYYAHAIIQSGYRFDMLFGPAYKGIPLATVTSVALEVLYNKNYPCGYNRKETKDHGEGGVVFGAPLVGRVLIIDDVISAGTALREVLALISKTDAVAIGAVIALDRQEQGVDACSAITEMQIAHQLAISAIINLDQMIEYITDKADPTILQKITAYRECYGA